VAVVADPGTGALFVSGEALPAVLAAFEKPTTKDFVWPCWGPSIRIFGSAACYNFIFFLVTLAVVSTIVFFYLAFRKPTIVPGKLQLVAELGFQFVRENIVLQMIGQEGMVFFAFLSSLFFYILFGNIWEVLPGVNATMNARIAFPMVLAVLSWIVYNAVGIRRHGVIGYAAKVMFPPGVPIALKPLIALINFVSEIIFRPITLTVRLFANMVAGHFLLAVFFLGTLALFSSANFLIIFGVFSSAMAVAFVAFEIFVSILQAFIFAVLSASYISEAMETAH
jgi:F-type H+-transporting ATPase subunit a